MELSSRNGSLTDSTVQAYRYDALISFIEVIYVLDTMNFTLRTLYALSLLFVSLPFVVGISYRDLQ